jgi:hypothetical protein
MYAHMRSKLQAFLFVVTEHMCTGDPSDPGAEKAEQAFWASYTTSWAHNEDLAMTWGIDHAFKVCATQFLLTVCLWADVPLTRNLQDLR